MGLSTNQTMLGNYEGNMSEQAQVTAFPEYVARKYGVSTLL